MRWNFKPGPVTLAVPLLFLTGVAGSSAPELLCTAQVAVDCGGDGICDIGDPQGIDMPPFVGVDLKKREIGTRDPDGSMRTSKIRSLERGSGRLILSGIENGRPWGIVISEQSGHMTATVADDGAGFAVFGHCTAYPS